jgi:hypothetical protein
MLRCLEEGVFARPLNLLRTAPKELWLVYALKVLDSYGRGDFSTHSHLHNKKSLPRPADARELVFFEPVETTFNIDKTFLNPYNPLNSKP